MGLFDVFKKQLVEVIEWVETGDGVLQYKFPVLDNSIKNGANLTVRESQRAVFVDEGRLADEFAPGRYTLTTKTLPWLAQLKNWDTGFISPFKADVYFFSTRLQQDQRWGTPQPITLRDKELGPLRLRANGSYAYRVQDHKVFFKNISGTRELYSTADLADALRNKIMTEIAAFLGKGSVPFLDMASNQSAFSDNLKQVLAPHFTQMGLQLEQFFVQSLSLPEDVQAHFDKLSSMNMLGDLKKYTQFQAADSIGKGGGSGVSGMGAELAVGAAVGQQIMGAMGGGAIKAGETEDPIHTIERLHQLVQAGALSQEDFERKKSELLKKI